MPPSLMRSSVLAASSRGGVLSSPVPCLRPRAAAILPTYISARHGGGGMVRKKKAKTTQPTEEKKKAAPERLSGDKRAQLAAKKKAKAHQAERVQWKRDPIEKGIFFPLHDAMRYIRAFEAGYPGGTTKYDLAINLRTERSGATVRSGVRLPHPIDSRVRVAVICAPDSSAAQEAVAAGAAVVGEDAVFEDIRNGRVAFERCLCHLSSLPKLQRAGVGRYLGPRGLMPNAKAGTVVKDVRKAMANLTVGTQFRERMGTIRAPVGTLSYTPEQLQANIRALMKVVTQQVDQMNARVPKAIHDVVLSSTHAPGIPLSGMLMNEGSPDAAELKERSLEA